MALKIDRSPLKPQPLTDPSQAGEVIYHGKKISSPETRTKLQKLAHILDKKIHITSGDRTPEDQERLRRQGYKPAKKSQHLQGRAADIQVEGMTPKEVVPYAHQVGFTGIGIYQGHLHVDTRESPAIWYNN